MGIKTFFHELKAKVAPPRLFRGVILDSHDILPKACPDVVTSVEVIEGGSTVAPGCVLKTNFVHDGHQKYGKNKVDHIDIANYVCKNTFFEGDTLGEKVEKICYEVKFEESADGGCLVKLKSEYHTKGDYELTDDEANTNKDQVLGLYKAIDDYLFANPNACT